jgi:phage shock protein A
MSESIFAKIRLVTLGNIHQLINKVIDLNSIAAVEQHVRDLENALEDLEASAAQAEGHKRFIVKQLAGKVGEKSGVDASINLIRNDGNPDNDYMVKSLAVKAVSLKRAIDGFQSQKEDAEKTDQMIDEAVGQMKALLESLGGKLAHLRQLDADAKAKEKAAASLKQASSVAAAGTGFDVDSIENRIEERAHTADAKFEQAMGTLNVAASADLQLAEAEAYLAQMDLDQKK